MATRAPIYYRPFYLSDSEEESDSEDDASYYSEEEQPNFKQLASNLFRAAGPPFPSEEKEIDFSQNILDRHATFGPFVEGQAGYKLVTTYQQVDNVAVIQSLDRDKLLYPQPTNCQLMLPRTYQRVTRFEIVDISFIASFFYFRADKYNTSILFNETGRMLYNPVLTPPPSTTPLNLTINIREGSYTIDTLLQELTIQFNTPPIFYDYINGYSEFYSAFITAGDYSLNFNYPGDYYYDSLRDVYISQPTTQQIVALYFQQRYALPTSKSVNNNFTDTQIKVAYYYPVIKEFILDSPANADLLAYAGVAITDAIKTSLLYNFGGLDDPIVSDMVQSSANLSILDRYRLQHTFRYYPVNNYVFTYANQNTRVSVQTTSLNTSLANLLNAQYSNFLSAQIQQAGISQADFLSSSTQLTDYRSILSQMYEVLQYNLAKIFGVNYGTYADTYFLTFSNIMLLKNGRGATNVAYDYNAGANPFISSNIQANFKTSNTVYWDSMTNLSTSNTYLTQDNVVYNPRLLRQDLNQFMDSNGYIYVNPVENTTDVTINVSPGSYTIIPITSKIRQTVQVETLPRPSIYLYPEWTRANEATTATNTYEFTRGYTYESPGSPGSLLSPSTIQNPIFPDLVDLGTIDPAESITAAFARQTSITMTIPATPNGTYFSFTTPNRLPEEDVNSTIYKYQLGLAVFASSTAVPIFSNASVRDAANNTFADDAILFVYHDQAAFYADVGPVGTSNGESPFFYKYKISLPAGSGAAYIPFTAYEAQTYYIFCRPQRTSRFSPTTVAIVPFCRSSVPAVLSTNDVSFDPRLPSFNPYTLLASNYIIAKVHDPDYIRLPIIDSNGFYYKTTIPSPLGVAGHLPSASNTVANVPVNTLLEKSITRIGYVSGVSDDLTDYIPIPGTLPPRAYDPTNKFMFRYTSDVSSYNPATETYDIGGANVIIYPNGSPYTFPATASNGNAERETKIVQYTGTHCIITQPNAFTAISSLLPLSKTTFPGLRTPFDSNSPIGFMFLPEEGTWSIKRIRFLSQTSNTNVHFLAIYPTTYVNSTAYTKISLSQAISICVLSESTTYYSKPSLTGVPYGTYYTYCNVLNPNSNYVISGRTQNSSNLITDTNAYYSVIAYSNSSVGSITAGTYTFSNFAASAITPIHNLTGTCIPYPSLTTPVLSSRFYDGTPSPDTDNDMILSSNVTLSNLNPNVNPAYANYYTSQYAQSSPIVNSHIHYGLNSIQFNDFVRDTTHLVPFVSIPDIPRTICATVGSHILFEAGEFPLVYFIPGDSNAVLYPKTVLTIDSIFPLTEDSIILSQAGTASNYIFLGCTSTSNLIFKAYNVATGNLIVTPPIPSRFDPQTSSVQGFQVKDTMWWLMYLDSSSDVQIIYGSNFTDPFISMTTPFTGPYTSAQMKIDQTGSNVYFSLLTDTTFSNVYSFPMSARLPSDLSLLPRYTLGSHSTSFSVTCYKRVEYIYSTRATQSRLYRTDTSTSTTVQSVQNYGRIPSSCVTGVNNSIYALFNSHPYVLTNVSGGLSVQVAWQQMFPVMKVELVQAKERRLAIPDLWNVSVPEWYHSVMFAYTSPSALSGDTQYTPSYKQWGHEENYYVGDTSFQGHYFNAYLQNVPIQASNTSYVAVRGFSPTESFQTNLRISLTNVYDYGYISVNNLISEIGTINSIPSQYSASYKNQLSTFDGSFVLSGFPAVYGLSSFYLPTVGFSNFIEQFSTMYNRYTILASNTNRINAALINSMNNFITTRLKHILPLNTLNRSRFTDSLTFSFLWKSGLQATPPNYANLVDGWGLGWNLGYPKEDDAQPATVNPAPSMYKIIEDFLYLRLNPEFNLNRISAGTKENYLDSREPSGLTSYYYCKLLLNGYGQNATTFVHSPIVLNPPIARISKLAFQWLDSKGNLLNIDSANDSDWQMTVNIQENVSYTNFEVVPGSSPLSLQAVKE
jgi:hypothetical protein